ncbi:MAG TPA: GGDEF domain-containing protein [Vicinamibacterales bacterium]|jgi:diguanylate cyclase (GGDEF)-like protein|nr:GGDEF domain-containing protein [Vicinamibacterales bacterium]
MDLFSRNDRMLLAGLAVALVVVFARPIQYLLDIAHDAEKASGLALMPGLVILVVVFFIHEQSKRQESKAQAAAAEVDMRQAQARTHEMERLLAFGQSLGRSLDAKAIRDIVVQHLPGVAGTEAAWVMTKDVRGEWRALVGPAEGDPRDVEARQERIAKRVLEARRAGETEPVWIDGFLCLPLMAGGDVVGVMGVPEAGDPGAPGRQRALATAATLLAISLRNADLFREVRENSVRDGLTGCFNRTHALEVIDIELRRARRSQMPVSLIMFDLDHFKNLNDRHGHLCGDAVLAAVGARMREVLRNSDLKCRYGGEEFLVLLPETPIEGARRVADNVRRQLGAEPVAWSGESVAISASFGVSTALPGEIDVQALIGRADAALYQAKAHGRNCVQLSTDTAA